LTEIFTIACTYQYSRDGGVVESAISSSVVELKTASRIARADSCKRSIVGVKNQFDIGYDGMKDYSGSGSLLLREYILEGWWWESTPLNCSFNAIIFRCMAGCSKPPAKEDFLVVANLSWRVRFFSKG